MSTITKSLAAIGVAALLAVAALTVTDALLRTYFSSPILGVSEVAELLSLVAVAAFLPLSFEKRYHLTIDFVATLFGPRAHRLLGLLGAAVTLVFFAVIVWRLAIYSLDQLRSGATTWFLAWPIAPWWMAATAFLAVCLPVQLLVIAKALRGDGDADAVVGPEGGPL
ncbi:TRAP transporter small permease [Vannielia litorea]|uniref:TRAP transporter small permease n=1 Tax=Vannielia litorea TaxID=1217970 RepID=UPI001BCF78E0|nr:TRAP transporter small permease [Vannielia litorea]MBS8224676.1 TRAP transporter small permease [Vannielia litorea]